MKIELIEDWKAAWRLWSVRFAAAVAVIPELVYRLAEAAEHLLPALSQPVLANLPPWLRTAAAVAALVAVWLRLVRQPSKASIKVGGSA